MKIRLIISSLCWIILNLTGCGQTGKLYLPNQCWNHNMTPCEIQPQAMSIGETRCDCGGV